MSSEYTAQKRGQNHTMSNEDRKVRSENKHLLYRVQILALILLSCMYVLTEFNLDAVIYKGVGMMGYLFSQDWATPVKASLSTLKPTIAAICAGFLALSYKIKT